MQSVGTVVKVKDKSAVVAVVRNSSCGENCSACGSCKKQVIEVTADCDIKVISGDKVVIESSSGRVLLKAFLVYILPLVIGFIAYGMFSNIISFFIAVLASFSILAFFSSKINQKVFIIKKLGCD